jgi:flavin reductase (DIM6/NTAB) family NADH-FMN oxidoreductase RutF
MAASPLPALEFRRALGHFATGIIVITVEREPGQVHGMTANSFASVSLDPPLVCVCVDHRARTLPLVKEKQRFGINVLKQEQQAFSEFFAGLEQSSEAQERIGVKFRWTEDRIPLVENVLCQLSCKLAGLHVAGDHTIVIAEVESAKLSEGEPLVFYRGRYHNILEK